MGLAVTQPTRRSKFSNQEVSKTRLRHLEVAPHEPRTKKMKAFGDGAWSNFHFPKVPPPGGSHRGSKRTQVALEEMKRAPFWRWAGDHAPVARCHTASS